MRLYEWNSSLFFVVYWRGAFSRNDHPNKMSKTMPLWTIGPCSSFSAWNIEIDEKIFFKWKIPQHNVHFFSFFKTFYFSFPLWKRESDVLESQFDCPDIFNDSVRISITKRISSYMYPSIWKHGSVIFQEMPVIIGTYQFYQHFLKYSK